MNFTGKKLFPWILFLACAIALAWFSPPPMGDHLNADAGEMLIHGLKNREISFKMPFVNVAIAFMEYHLGLSVRQIISAGSAVLFAGAYALCFLIGARFGGPVAAFLCVLIPATVNRLQPGYNLEQIIYSFFLLVALERLLRRTERRGVWTSAAAGLSIGFTLLIRSPLFLFPFVVVFMDYFRRKKNMRFVLNSAVFLLSSYILLLPWMRVNHFLFGKLIPFEEERATCNIITGVKGSTFTMEGDARALAGIKRTESVYKWAAKELLNNPRLFLSAVPRRLLEVFYLHPLLVFLSLLALFLRRKDERVLLICAAAGYFVFVYCLMSIETRYFYPLRYILAFPAAVGAVSLASAAVAGVPFLAGFFPKEKFPVENGKFAKFYPFCPAVFFIAFASVAALEAVLATYPARAQAHELAKINEELKKFPGDRWLYKRKGEMLLRYNMTEEGLKNLETALKIAPEEERALDYILNTLKAEKAADIEEPPRVVEIYHLLIVKMLKELQLGADARHAFEKAFGWWDERANLLRKPVTEKDFEILEEIKKTNRKFWKADVYNALFYWPYGERFDLVCKLGEITGLTIEKRLKYLKMESPPSVGETAHKGNGTRPPQAVEFDYNNTALFHLSRILERVAAGGSPRETEDFFPLLAVDEIISGETGKENAKDAVRLFHDRINSVGFGELGRIIKLFENSGDSQTFARESENLLRADPENALYLFINYRARLRAQPEKTEGILKEANRRLKTMDGALLKGAWYLLEEGEKEKALALFESAGREKSESLEEGKMRYLILQRLGRHEKALAEIDSLIEKHPENPFLLNDRGVILKFLGENRKAGESFAKALSLSPDFYIAKMNLASVFLAGGKTAEAEEIFRKVLASNAPAPIKKDAAEELERIIDLLISNGYMLQYYA